MLKASVWTRNVDNGASCVIMLPDQYFDAHSTTGDFMRRWWLQLALSNQMPVNSTGPPFN